MYLCDYHVHSDVSADSSATMREMLDAECAAGMREICFTNHLDMTSWADFKPVDVLPTAAEESLRKARELGDTPIPVRVGIELGEAQQRPELARLAAQTEGLDFVLGSTHVLPGLGDCYILDYTSREQCVELYGRYMDCLLATAELGCFDVMAHVGYCRRYMSRQGLDVKLTVADYGDKIRRLFRLIIDGGRGIEINCSGLRDGLESFPDAQLLRLYRSMGGEILTVGSDAHRPADAAKCVREGFELAKSCGFRYVALYERRVPSFTKID